MEKNAELSETLSTERILLQLQLMDKHTLNQAKKVLVVNKKSDRVKINKHNEKLTLMKLQQVLKNQFFCMIYNNKLKKLYNAASILICGVTQTWSTVGYEQVCHSRGSVNE